MNSTKLFNLKYLWQNFKKSKSLLILLFCATFFINTWMVAIKLLSKEYIIDFYDLSSISIFASFIVPVILAFSLYGFIFKRGEIDFVLSKPLSRRQIFITNLVGGIVYLFLLILLNTIVFIILSLFTDLFIPINAIFDYFLYFLITYIFIYIVTILSISISGSRIGAIVIILLILLLYPCITTINYNLKTTSEYAIYLKGDDNYQVNELFTNTFTTPINYFRDYNDISIIKTIILTLIYIIVSFYLFKNKNMEDSGVSFKNNKLYKAVKIFTYIPITYISFYMVLNDTLFFPIAVIICATYFIVYDLLVKKELKQILRLIIELIVSTILLIAIYLLIFIYYNYNGKYLDMPDSIDVSLPDYNGYTNYVELITITDKDLINELISKNVSSTTNNYINVYIDGSYYLTNNISDETLEKLIDRARNVAIPEFNPDNIIHATSSINFKLVIKLNKEILNEIYNYMLEYDMNDSLKPCYITLYKYEDNIIKTKTIDVSSNEKILNYVKNSYNKSFIDNYDEFFINDNESIDISVLREYENEFIKFLNEHKYDELTEDYIILYSNLDKFYISKNLIEEFILKWSD